MAATNNPWQKVPRSDTVKEYFKMGEFITPDTWIPSEPPLIINDYNYQKDRIQFRGNIYESDINNEIRVTEITHATSFENACKILDDGGFRPGTKYIPGIGDMNLIWFGLKIGEAEIDKVREKCKRCAYVPLQCGLPDSEDDSVADWVASQFANTAPFQPMSRYGNVKFTFSIENVLDAYQEQFCSDPFQLRKLGTFAYQQETMHVILVCPPDTEGIGNCPPITEHVEDPIILPDENLEKWTWWPYSTGECKPVADPDSRYPPCYKRWEHVTFAFVVRDGGCLQIDNLNHHMSLCLHLTKKFEVASICNTIDNLAAALQDHEVLPPYGESLATLLRRMIRRYIDEMPLYKKMAIAISKSNLIAESLNLDVKWFDQNCKEMLPMEFASLDCSPC